MAESKPKTRTAKPSGSRAKPKTTTRATSKRNGTSAAARSRAAKSRSTKPRSTKPSSSASSSNGSRSPARTNGSSGVAGSLKHAASKAAGPAVAVGAAAAGVAGGIILKNRTRRKTVLGVPVPKHLPTVDPKSVAKTVGNASRQFAKTSKSVSKDIERAGDQAERIGKILG